MWKLVFSHLNRFIFLYLMIYESSTTKSYAHDWPFLICVFKIQIKFIEIIDKYLFVYLKFGVVFPLTGICCEIKTKQNQQFVEQKFNVF